MAQTEGLTLHPIHTCSADYGDLYVLFVFRASRKQEARLTVGSRDWCGLRFPLG